MNPAKIVVVDAAGNTYITGDSGSDLFPTTAGAFQTTKGAFADVFVTKLNAAGTGLVYSTYLGGGSSDIAFGIAVDAAGNAYVTGETESSAGSPFPIAPGAFHTTIGSFGIADAFMTKLNAAGTALLYSTYLDGGKDDEGGGIRNGTETRATVLSKIAENAVLRQNEYTRAFVLMQYFGYLRRDIDHSGYDFWLDVLNNREPGNFRGMVCAFVTSAEYQDRFGSIHSHTNAECSH